MDNPFKKRATEYIADPQGLLSLLSAEPLKLFLDEDEQFDRVVIVVGTPGSGKTTIAKLFEFDTLVTLCSSVNNAGAGLRQLAAVLHEKKVLVDSVPRFLAYRLPAGSSLRDIWELPYQESVKHALLRSFIQARAALGWIRRLERAEVRIADITIVPREDAESQAQVLNLVDPVKFRNHARVVEEQIFRVITALVPPKEEELAQLPVPIRYNLFDSIRAFRVPRIPGVSEVAAELQPMIILDDAHELHPTQFGDTDLWLRDREIKLARWVLTRVDAIGHSDFRRALSDAEQESKAGTTPQRDRIIKLMQKERTRVTFRSIARDISKKYLTQMPIFVRRGLDSLDRCLREDAPTISQTNLKLLQEEVHRLEKNPKLSPKKIKAIKSTVPEKLKADVAMAVYRILLTRELRKTPQDDLFGVDVELEEEEEASRVKPSVVMGAEIQLLHQFDRPFYFGFDRIADCSTSNIEQFIGLAGSLVEQIEAKIIKNKDSSLDAREQHKVLMERAQDTMKRWDFPHCDAARRLVAFIGQRCVEKSLEPNAPLGEGANAFGIPQAEMDRLQEASPALAQVLHYALAYNALSLKENYLCKGKSWCLLELGGVPSIAFKLPLVKGNFCEGKLIDLQGAISE
ncbi:hypothetical protein [Acidovorax sp. NCPPB 4044]|uniref:hypothetical protein n=1 Tax=Acidovorax sp. NCPPB 4044 TaxID=2940490 RepID=UPI002302B7DD|nr:hypothetical protein [Acidovorax sp. NCPPB 4044]MDA8522935.1 hypothetical protein [Acidovorax sp. NCPPB 4044]